MLPFTWENSKTYDRKIKWFGAIPFWKRDAFAMHSSTPLGSSVDLATLCSGCFPTRFNFIVECVRTKHGLVWNGLVTLAGAAN